MNSLKRIAWLLNMTALNMTAVTIALSAVTTQASEALQTRSASTRSVSVMAQLDQNGLGPDNLEQNDGSGTVLEDPAPSEAPLETVPSPPDAGTTLPSPLEPTPTDPAADAGDSGTNALDPGETLPQTPTSPEPTLDNGVVPDRTPAPVRPLNNLPNNNVPDPRQNVPNPSIDTTPN